MSKILQEERIDTDVLIVGAGAGGMMAAISAAENGARVVLCEKGNARRSGGIYAGNDHFVCYIPGVHIPDYRDSYVRESITRNIADEDLIRQFIDMSYSVLQRWESFGINMKTDGHYEFVGHAWPGSRGKSGEHVTGRTFLHFSDRDSSVKLEKQVRERGVRVLNRVMVTELLKDSNGRVVGAIGICTREQKLFVFQAKAVIINKGGVDSTRLYASPNVIGYMAAPAAGDGVMMAYRAGASVRNAELTGRQNSLRFGPWAGKGTWVGVTRDNEGKPIGPPYLTKPDAETGDMAIEDSDNLDRVWAMGKGPVWMDPRGISDEDEKYMRWGFDSEAMIPFLRWLDRENIDIKKTRFEFFANQPGSTIQPKVDINYRTTVEGLYAITPGMLSWSAVGGQISGEKAAKYAQGVKSSVLDNLSANIAELKQGYEDILNRTGQPYAGWREAQWAVWQTMRCYALPPGRTEGTLLAGLNQLSKIKEKTHNLIKAGNPHELCHCIEVLNLMDVAELVMLAVNERRESRGQSRRMDYPFINPMLNKFLVITQKDGSPSFSWEPPRRG